MRADVDALLARARLRLPGDIVETVSIVATLALLQGSDAVSILPLDLALHYAEHGMLARLPLTFPAGGSATDLLTRANRRLAPAARDFVVALRALASSPASRAATTPAADRATRAAKRARRGASR